MSLVIAAPALPLHTAGPYVAAAYIVFVAVLLIYLAIMARRLRRTERELLALREELDARQRADHSDRDLEPVPAGVLTRAPAVASQPDDAAAARLSEPGGRAGGVAAGERGPA